jgi:predicted SnoaL-like aldol condensation-catalyzing enzyme
MTLGPFHRIASIIAVVLLALAGCYASQPLRSAQGQCTGSAQDNREAVLAFYRLALIERRPREAFEQYAAPGMIEHKPDVPGGARSDVIKYLQELITELPQARWEVLRVAAEGDIVFLHAKFVRQPGAAPYAIVDVFRLEECKIVEHWDVVARPPEAPSNPNPRF